MKRKTKALKMFENCYLKSLSRVLPRGRAPGGTRARIASAQRRLVARAGAGRAPARFRAPCARGGCAGGGGGCPPRLRSRRDRGPSQERKSKEAHWPPRRADDLEMCPFPLRQLQLSAAEVTVHARIPAPLAVSGFLPRDAKNGDRFCSKTDEAVKMACARAMASYRAPGPAAPSRRRSQVAPPHDGPVTACPRGGVRRAGVLRLSQLRAPSWRAEGALRWVPVATGRPRQPQTGPGTLPLLLECVHAVSP